MLTSPSPIVLSLIPGQLAIDALTEKERVAKDTRLFGFYHLAKLIISYSRKVSRPKRKKTPKIDNGKYSNYGIFFLSFLLSKKNKIKQKTVQLGVDCLRLFSPVFGSDSVSCCRRYSNSISLCRFVAGLFSSPS